MNIPPEARQEWLDQEILDIVNRRLAAKNQLNIKEVNQMVETQTNWIEEELKQTSTPNTNYEKLESLKLEAGKIVKFTVDFSKAFDKWQDPKNGTIKAIIPVTHKEVKKNFWLNVKNPLFRELLERGKKGQVTFAVSTNGSQKDTKYSIVEED